MSSLHRLTGLTTRVVAGGSAAVFLALVVDVLWGVLTRYALGAQAPWTEELARLLLVWLSMLGTALAYANAAHLGVDTLLQALSPDARRLTHASIHGIVGIFAAVVMLYGGTTLFLERLAANQVMTALPIAKAWVYLAIPISGALVTLVALDGVVAHSKAAREPV
jgi:TRAP-type C4-dicarboxylate transport system permease small subunit